VLSDIIEPRVEEIFAVVRKRIEDTGLLEQLSAGAVLTGGAVLMEGMPEFAEEILGMPVRLGYPVGIGGITQLVQGPQYATGVGLVKYGAEAIRNARRVKALQAPNPACAPCASWMRPPAPAAAPATTPGGARKPPKPSSNRFWDWLRAAF
jgi:cell division protein FtsA